MANNLGIKDGAGADQTVKTTDNAGVHTPHHNVDTISGPLGRAADAASVSAALSTEDVAILGATNETAPATDTAAAGHNGRLQRIAQRLTTLLAVFPTTIDVNSGNKSASTLRVVLATDQPTMSNAQPVSAASLPLPTGAATAAKQPALGTAGTASSDVITVQGIASGTPAQVVGGLATVSGNFTRPADTTAYTAGDVVSNATSGSALLSIAGCARVNQGSGYIVGARLITDKKSITPRIRVHVYNASNPTFAHDNSAVDIRYADISKRIGTFDLPAMSTGADSTNSTSSQAQDMNMRLPFVCASATTTLYFLFEALDAFAPASGEAFTLVLFCDQN
jgi:hypothetical protein